jgi:acetyl esterase/lipase
VPERPLPPFVTGPPVEPWFEARLLGVDRVRENRDVALAASPVTHVRPGAPPFLLMHGDRDGLISSDRAG